MAPPDLEHELPPGPVAGRRDPGALPTRAAGLAELQRPFCGDLVDQAGEGGKPGAAREKAVLLDRADQPFGNLDHPGGPPGHRPQKAGTGRSFTAAPAPDACEAIEVALLWAELI